MTLSLIAQLDTLHEVDMVRPLRNSKGMPRISSKHQVTLPVESLKVAGLGPGDEVAIVATGPEQIVVRKAGTPDDAFGVFDGLYEAGYLEALRAKERA